MTQRGDRTAPKYVSGVAPIHLGTIAHQDGFEGGKAREPEIDIVFRDRLRLTDGESAMKTEGGDRVGRLKTPVIGKSDAPPRTRARPTERSRVAPVVHARRGWLRKPEDDLGLDARFDQMRDGKSAAEIHGLCTVLS